MTYRVENFFADFNKSLKFITEQMSFLSSWDESLKAVQYWQDYPNDPAFNDRIRFDESLLSIEILGLDAYALKSIATANLPTRIEVFQIFFCGDRERF